MRTGGYGPLRGEWVNWDLKKYIVGVQEFSINTSMRSIKSHNGSWFYF